MDFAASLMPSGDDADVARKAYQTRKMIKTLQDSLTSIEKCPQPVIAAVHSACIGGGVDMISTCDIRYSTDDAWFQIKVLIIIDIQLKYLLKKHQNFYKK